MSRWREMKMGSLCKIKSGKSNAQDAVDDGAYVFFDRSKNIKRSTQYLYDCEALIIPGEGAEFLPRHFVGKFDLHQRAYALFDFTDAIDVRYLYYYLIFFKDWFVKVAVGATVKSLRLRHFEDLPVVVAPLAEQKRIVAMLDEAFAAIDTATAHARQNLTNARELFESHLKAVFSRRGNGWTEHRLLDIASEFGRGRSRHRPRNAEHLYGGPYPFVQTGDIRNAQHVITDYSQTYSEAGLAQSKLWPEGTVCITIAANIAETALLGFEGCFPDSVIGVVADPNKANSEFVEFMLQAFRVELQAVGKGSAQDNINMGTFETRTFPFPSVAVQDAIVARLNNMAEASRQLAVLYMRKLALLAELKQSILQKAFTGELTADAAAVSDEIEAVAVQ